MEKFKLQSKKEKSIKKLLHVWKAKPISLQCENLTSLKVVFTKFTLLRLQSINSHSKKIWLSKYPLEKSHLSKMQFSYSARGKREML